MLIVLGGLPAVGESTVAKALVRRIWAVHLHIDTIEQALRNAGLGVWRPEGYLVASDLAGDILRIGQSAFVDSVSPLAITGDYWRGTAASAAVRLVEIELVCSDRGEHQERVASRVTDIPGLELPN